MAGDWSGLPDPVAPARRVGAFAELGQGEFGLLVDANGHLAVVPAGRRPPPAPPGRWARGPDRPGRRGEPGAARFPVEGARRSYRSPAVPDDPTPSRLASPGPSRRAEPADPRGHRDPPARLPADPGRAGAVGHHHRLLGAAGPLAQVNAAKVRKDLSLLGSFGTRGAGYDPAFLIAQIDRPLGVDEDWSVVIVGIGNLGRALTRSQGFASRGFDVTALFDVDPDVIGEEIDGVGVRHMDDLPRSPPSGPRIGVITTPGWAAQRVADLLVEAGVRSLLNFAPRVLDVPPHVQLRYVDLSIELQVLGFYQSRMADAPTDNRMPVIRSIGLTTSPSE